MGDNDGKIVGGKASHDQGLKQIKDIDDGFRPSDNTGIKDSDRDIFQDVGDKIREKMDE